MAVSAGVYAMYENAFTVGKLGKASIETDMVPVAEMETFEPVFEGDIQEWSPMSAKGWMKRKKTGNDLKITVTGKRYIGDEGNDFIAETAWKVGDGCETTVKWTFPNGDTMAFDAVVNVTSGGGDSKNLDPLVFELLCNGEPVYTAAP